MHGVITSIGLAAVFAVATGAGYRGLFALERQLGLSAGFTVVGLVAAFVLLLFVPREIGVAAGPVWTRAGAAAGLLAVLVIVLVDGVLGERGRLRTLGVVVLGSSCGCAAGGGPALRPPTASAIVTS